MRSFWFEPLHSSTNLKGLCHPRCMRKMMKSTLTPLAQLFQIPSESSGRCYTALDVNVNVHRLILKNCLYFTESDSGCRNQANLRRNTSLRKRPTGLYCACAPADIVPLSLPSYFAFNLSVPHPHPLRSFQ